MILAGGCASGLLCTLFALLLVAQIIQVALRVASDGGCSGNRLSILRIDAPALAPLTVHRHLALFEVEEAVLVAVGDVKGVEVFQWTPLVREVHGGDPLQDLVQLLLTQTPGH